MPEKFSEKNKQYITGVREQRSSWITFSVGFSILLLVLGIGWNQLLTVNNPILWGGVGLILFPTAICWWYWTMKIINFFLDQRFQEISILGDIVSDVKLIKQEVEALKKISLKD